MREEMIDPATKRFAAYAPYDVAVYHDLLTSLARVPGVAWLPFSAPCPADAIGILLRHDIDTLRCIRNLQLLLNVDRTLGVTGGVHFRVDPEVEYSLSDYRDEVVAARDAGFDVGLHTVCYLEDDFLGELRRECALFERAVGFAPPSFSVHGLGLQRADVRQRFYEEIVGRLGEFGFLFSDCHPRLRQYAYVFEDCHWDDEKRCRFIYNDFTTTPRFLGRGGSHLILTHPCYWK